MQLRSIVIALFAFAIAGCATTTRDAGGPSVDITLTELAAGQWQLDLTFERATRTLIFLRSEDGLFRGAWVPIGDTPRVERKGGIDAIYFPQPVTSASYLLKPKQANPVMGGFISFGGGETAIATSQFDMAMGASRRAIENANGDISKLRGLVLHRTLLIRSASPVFADGQQFEAGLASFELNEDTYVFVGGLEPQHSTYFTSLLDPHIPDAIGATFQADFERLFAYYQEQWGYSAETKPVVLFAYQGNEEDGSVEEPAEDSGSVTWVWRRGSFAGRVAPDSSIMLLVSGDLFARNTDRNRARIMRFFAHEVAHVYQEGWVADLPGESAAWIPEGLAETMAFDAMRSLELDRENYVLSVYNEHMIDCAQGLKRNVLTRLDRELHYSCGNLLGVMAGAALENHSVYDLWNAMVFEGRASHHTKQISATIVQFPVQTS
ncbi:MAG: hypothetical protein AAFV54_09920 [Pseudomonadota bacterium]